MIGVSLPMKKQLLIAGGTGLIGSALQMEAVRHGWDVTILSRKKGPSYLTWDPRQGSIALTEPRAFDAIVNLAGSSIAGGRWTKWRKKEILQSRIDACLTLEKYLKKGQLQTRVYIGASGVGIYGDKGNSPVDESSPVDSRTNWMSALAQDWEAAHKRIEALHIRTVILRTGIVLSSKGGALSEILKTAPFGILGYFGSGNQFWPWIHIDDMVRIMLKAIDEENLQGTLLGVSPHPVTNKELAVAASKQYRPHRIVMPVPVLFLKAMLGKMHQMLMDSCNAYPKQLLNEGFIFHYNSIDEAMADLINKTKR